MQLDELDPKKALMSKLMGPGIAPGEGAPNAGPPPAVDTPMSASPIADAPAAPASDFGRTMGFDAGKFADPNKHDFKYDTGRTLSQFDPKQGITPEVLAALNKLDYGTFAGSGDKLSLTGAKNAKDAGDFGPQDWIGGFKAGNDSTKWNFGGGAVGNAEAAAGPPAQAGQGPAGMSLASLDPLLSGDPMAKIQAALAQLSGPKDNASELLRQLMGGANG